MSNLLEIKDLKVSFKQYDTFVNAINGIDLCIKEGEILRLVGESGSGKTVTALSITRLLPKTAVISGEIRFLGKELLSLNQKGLTQTRGKQIAYILLYTAHDFISAPK